MFGTNLYGIGVLCAATSILVSCSAGCGSLAEISDRLEALALQELQTIRDEVASRQDDPDRDGLSTVQKGQLATNPNRRDTDDDLVDDRRELELGTDPNTQDREVTVDGVPSTFDGLN